MQTLKMDFQSQSAPPVVPVMQSDSQSRFIGITLYDGGVAYEAPEGAQYTVQYRGPGANNMGWYDTIQLSSGTRKSVVVDSTHPNVVTLELAEQALRVNGPVEVSLCVVNNTGYKLNTFPIICRVTGAPYVDPVSVRSYFYVTGITSEQWLAYVTACQDAQKRAEDAAQEAAEAAKTLTIDATLTQEGQAADAAKVGEAVNAETTRAKAAEEANAKGVSQLKEDLAYGFQAINQPCNDVYGKTIHYDYDKFNLLDGFVSKNGKVVNLDAFDYKHFSIRTEAIKNIKINKGSISLGASDIYYAVLILDNGQVIQLINENTQNGSADFIDGIKGNLYLNVFGAGYADSFEITYYSEQEYKKYLTETSEISRETKLYNISHKYNHIIKKPMSFNGDLIYFFGDSITHGVCEDYKTTKNGYPKLFCDKVGATFVNCAVSGSLLVSGHNLAGNTTTPINEVIRNTDMTSVSKIFIAGGINDWQSGVPISDFAAGVTSLCEYLSTHYSGKEIFFITPINVAEWNGSQICEQEYYTQALFEAVMKYPKFSIINGQLFNFPLRSDDRAYQFDGLHPTEVIGYNLYANSLLTVLC